MTCWDCGKRVGTVDALDDRRSGASVILKICTICANRWRPFMQRKDQCVSNSVEWALAW